jgi:hypothetical protein
MDNFTIGMWRTKEEKGSMEWSKTCILEGIDQI